MIYLITQRTGICSTIGQMQVRYPAESEGERAELVTDGRMKGPAKKAAGMESGGSAEAAGRARGKEVGKGPANATLRPRSGQPLRFRASLDRKRSFSRRLCLRPFYHA